MPKVTYQTFVHVVTTRLVDGKPTETKHNRNKDLMGFSQSAHCESIVGIGCKTNQTLKEATKHHEALTAAFILLRG